MKKLFLTVSVLFIYILLITNLSAQISTDLRPDIKSPEVNKFEQYLNMPVNMVSGTPQVSIPIYTLNYNGMSLPITLEYDASGIKVEDISSSVGLKWSLNVGGTVSRIVKGAPDEGNPYSNAISLINLEGYYQDYGLSKLESELNLYSTSGERFTQFNKWIRDVANGYKDSQPDLFYFSTPQGGNKFVFNENREVIYLENTDFKIKETFTPNKFDSWQAISPTGVIYKYGEQNSNESTYAAGVGEITNQFKVNSWFLTEILNQVNNQKITIEYIDNYYSDVFNNKPFKTTTACLTEPTNTMAIGGCGNGVGEYSTFAQNPFVASSPSDALPHLMNYQFMENHVKSKLISKIYAGNILIDFIYANRVDLLPELGVNPKYLQSLQISYNGKCIKKFNFEYSYMISPNFTSGIGIERQEIVKKRLILNKVKEISCDQTLEKNYTFIYNSQVLPHRLSYAQDKWGYYNGEINNSSLFPKYLNSAFNNFGNRAVNFETTKAGTLEKIIYPTQGSVEFQYEAHQSLDPTDYQVGNWGSPTISLNSSSSTTNTASATFTYNPDKFYKLSISMIDPMGYSGCGSAKACTITNVNNTSGIPDFSYRYDELVNRSCYNDGISYNCSTTIDVPINEVYFQGGGDYIIQVFGYKEGTATCLSSTAQLFEASKIPVYDVGGLRVRKIIHLDTDQSIEKETTYTYLAPKLIFNPSPVHRAEYDYNQIWDSLYGLLSPYNVDYLKTSSLNSQNSGASYFQGYYYSLSPGHDPFFIEFMGPHISYGSVVESDGNSSSSYSFQPYQSYSELNSYQILKLYPPNSKYQSVLAGEKLTESYGGTVSSVLNQNLYNSSRSNTSVIGLNVSGRVGDNEIFLFDKYYVQNQLKSLYSRNTIETFNGQELKKTTEYYYEGVEHYQPTRIVTTDSKGKQIITKNYFPPDLVSEPFMADLKAQNNISSPIKIETYFNGTLLTDLLNKQITKYNNTTSPNGLILPKEVFTQKGSDQTQEVQRIVYEQYDTNGNLQQYKEPGKISTSLIWGYQQTQPLAKVENATYAQVLSYVANLQTLSDADNDRTIGALGNEGALRTALNNLRTALPNAMVTTYTYDPLIGVTSITDVKGETIYYHYDNSNRLEYVMDKDGKVLGKNEYHYKN